MQTPESSQKSPELQARIELTALQDLVWAL